MVKPGYKTTEFWVTIIIQILGILMVTGTITPEQSDVLGQSAVQLGGIIAAVAAAFGYSLSRGRVKG
jgi:hypothetical protein